MPEELKTRIFYMLSINPENGDFYVEMCIRDRFTDYAYINEDSLVIRSGLTRQRIYEILLALTRRPVSYTHLHGFF